MRAIKRFKARSFATGTRNWGGRLGLEPSDVFEEVADVVGHPGSVNLMVWLSRAPEDRTPECMGFEAFHDDSGFRYRWTA